MGGLKSTYYKSSSNPAFLVFRLTSLLFIILFINKVNAQTELIGETSEGGRNGVGVIFKINNDGTGYDTLFSSNKLTTSVGFTPISHLVKCDDKWYGILSNAGAKNDSGALFSFDLTNHSCKKLFSFSKHKGKPTFGSIVKTPKGKLYLATSSDSTGNIFCYNPSYNSCKRVLNFDTTDGKYPFGGLLYYDDKLYGMTAYGGAYNFGELYCFNPVNNKYKKLYDFDRENGIHPWGNLIVTKDGELYGMASGGGVNDTGMWNKGDGVLFRFDISKNTFTKLYDFNFATGGTPQGSLIQAANGKLYGTTWYGGANKHGVVFMFDPANNTYTLIHSFNNDDGSYPQGSLILAKDNMLYGMTSRGGMHGCGVIFTIDTSTNTFKKMHDFDRVNGALPLGDLSEVK